MRACGSVAAGDLQTSRCDTFTTQINDVLVLDKKDDGDVDEIAVHNLDGVCVYGVCVCVCVCVCTVFVWMCVCVCVCVCVWLCVVWTHRPLTLLARNIPIRR